MYTLKKKNIVAIIAITASLLLPTVNSFAYGGSTVYVATPTPISVISNSGNSSGGGGGIRSFRGSGGGSGSLASTLLQQCQPTLSNIFPTKNTDISELKTVQFNTSTDVNVMSLAVSINGNQTPVTTSPFNGGYKVSANFINPSFTRSGSNIISVSATGKRYGCKTTTIYRIDVEKNNVSGTVPIASNPPIILNAVKTAPILPNKEIAIKTPASFSRVNACDNGEVHLDGEHDTSKIYGDIEGHWAKEYILDLTKRCIVHGRELGIENNFQPDEIFNRAEAAKVLVKTYNLYSTRVVSTPFLDIKADAWYSPYIVSARKAGLIQGYADRSFHPERGISRVEALAMVARANGVDISSYKGNSGFTDIKENQWFAPYIAWAMEKGIVSNTNGEFNPTMVISRAEYAMMVSLAIR